MINSVLEIEVWLVALTIISLGALVISVCAAVSWAKVKDQIDDADDKANRAHEVVTGITLDDAAVYGAHAKGVRSGR